MAKKTINELFLLRAIAAMSLVMMHAIFRSFGEELQTVRAIGMLLTFGTPTFVFISEFILASAYPDRLPEKFWRQRAKYLLLPYVLFGTFYGLVKAVDVYKDYGSGYMGAAFELIFRNVFLADYNGYFILLILQFYALHHLFNKYVYGRFPAKYVIAAGVIVQVLYLSFFQFVKAPNIAGMDYVWLKAYWFPFTGWLAYFTIAYYTGRNYEVFKQWLSRNAKWVIAAPVITAMLPLAVLYWNEHAAISSKRVDMIPFILAMIMFLFLTASWFKAIPGLIMQVSRYSFGIYLLHPFYMALFKTAEAFVPVAINPYLLVPLYFVGSIVLSSATAEALNRVKGGAYLIGRLGTVPRPRSGQAPVTEAFGR